MYPLLSGEALAPVILGKVISINATIASNAVKMEKTLGFIRRYFSQTRVKPNRRDRSGIGISQEHQSLNLLMSTPQTRNLRLCLWSLTNGRILCLEQCVTDLVSSQS